MSLDGLTAHCDDMEAYNKVLDDVKACPSEANLIRLMDMATSLYFSDLITTMDFARAVRMVINYRDPGHEAKMRAKFRPRG
jgi:hypothetical protein